MLVFDTYAADVAVFDAVSSAKKEVTDAQETLDKTIEVLSGELNSARLEIESKDDQLQTFIVVVCVISAVALLGSCAFVTWFFIDRKKRSDK